MVMEHHIIECHPNFLVTVYDKILSKKIFQDENGILKLVFHCQYYMIRSIKFSLEGNIKYSINIGNFLHPQH